MAIAAIVVGGCESKGPVFGDTAKIVVLENRLDEAVVVTYRYDGEDEFQPAGTVPPDERQSGPIMIWSEGVQLRGVTKAGKVVLDRHYRWEEMQPGNSFVIIIEP